MLLYLSELIFSFSDVVSCVLIHRIAIRASCVTLSFGKVLLCPLCNFSREGNDCLGLSLGCQS